MFADSTSGTPPDSGSSTVPPDSGLRDQSVGQESQNIPSIPVPSRENADLQSPISPTSPADVAPSTEPAKPSDSPSVGSSLMGTRASSSEPVSATGIPSGGESDPIARVQRFVQEGKRTEALRLITDTLMSNPNDPKGLYLYAQLTTDRGAAIQALKNALKLQPDYFEARLLLDRLESAPETSPTSHAIPSGPSFPYTPPHSPSSDNLLQQMLVQHHMLMEQQLLTQHQLSQQQMLNQQQLAQQQLMSQRATSNVLLVADRNELAFWLGVIAALLGFFGIAHLITGRIGTGIIYLLLGFVWDGIAVTLAATGIGACIVLPLHLVFSYYNAKDGARNVNVVTGTVIKL